MSGRGIPHTCATTEPSGRVGSSVVGTSAAASVGGPMSTRTCPSPSSVGWISPAHHRLTGMSRERHSDLLPVMQASGQMRRC